MGYGIIKDGNLIPSGLSAGYTNIRSNPNAFINTVKQMLSVPGTDEFATKSARYFYNQAVESGAANASWHEAPASFAARLATTAYSVAITERAICYLAWMWRKHKTGIAGTNSTDQYFDMEPGYKQPFITWCEYCFGTNFSDNGKIFNTEKFKATLGVDVSVRSTAKYYMRNAINYVISGTGYFTKAGVPPASQTPAKPAVTQPAGAQPAPVRGGVAKPGVMASRVKPHRRRLHLYSGDDVKAVQAELIAKGVQVKPDGALGPKTLSAISKLVGGN